MHEKHRKHLHLTYSVLTLPCENETSLFIHFYNAVSEYYPLDQAWCEKFVNYRENKQTITRYIQNVHHWHEHKHAKVLAIGQLRHQSATAPSLATHAADAVAAHQYHERDSNVIFTSYVR